MKEEDLDWKVYHLLMMDETRSGKDLAAAAGCAIEDLDRSLHRLEAAMLIETREGMVRVLPVQEILLKCQSRHDKGCPFEFDGGVIREKRPGERH
ncbi:MAG: MarR family transcriptional regulator [Methanolinea sp.]|nr:MarR family transcriptional regulator [Methanolinea sp.]